MVMGGRVVLGQQREYLESQVAERALHDSIEQVRTTCSFARAERLLGREYHGRFLIEMLQNAADAWRDDPRAAQSRARVRVVLTEEPALLVANEGVPIVGAWADAGTNMTIAASSEPTLSQPSGRHCGTRST